MTALESTMRLFLAVLSLLLVPRALSQDMLVPRGATWAYLDNGSEQGLAWRAPGFDDSSWASGPAQLGYGDGDEATIVSFGPDPQQKHVTTYFRHEFSVVNPSAYTMLDLRLLRDDGAVVYLNGREVVRSALPAGPVRSSVLATERAFEADEEAFAPTVLPASQLLQGVNVLAVELHQVSVSSSDASFDLELVGTDRALLRHGPYLQKVGPDRAVVRWRTSIPVVGELRYGSAPNALGTTLEEASARTEHRLELTGLAPLSEIYYAVGDTSGATLAGGDSNHRFRTSPPAGSSMPFRAWILGDSGMANADARRVRDAFEAFAAQRPADLILLLGDNAYPWGSDLEYHAALFLTYAEALLRTPLWPSIGNHEQDLGVYQNLFSLPRQGEIGGLASGVEEYYSFDHANVHFVCLDSYYSDRSVGGPMWTWCRDDLAATTQDWSVVFFHHPPYSRGGHDSDNEIWMIEMRENFAPLFEDQGVALVLTGHSHGYERSPLIDGHYGDSSTFDPATMVLDGGDGQIGGNGAYLRAPGPHNGTVYVVAGSSAKLSPGPFDHPATVYSALELGSLVLDVHGGRMDVRFLDDQSVVLDSFTLLDPSWDGSYCIGSNDGQGCVASLGATGTPSISSGQPFLVEAQGLRSQSFGLLFYGFEAVDGGPFADGRLCVQSPLRRTAVSFSGGTGPCTGSLGFDFASIWNDPQHPGLDPGTTVTCQFWYRDTTSLGSAVTEALSFVIEP